MKDARSRQPEPAALKRYAAGFQTTADAWSGSVGALNDLLETFDREFAESQTEPIRRAREKIRKAAVALSEARHHIETAAAITNELAIHPSHRKA